MVYFDTFLRPCGQRSRSRIHLNTEIANYLGNNIYFVGSKERISLKEKSIKVMRSNLRSRSLDYFNNKAI